MKTLHIKWVNISLLSIFIYSVETGAQISISGKVQDNLGQDLPFASVLLLKSTDSSLVAGIVANENGTFKFERVNPGSYLINTSLLGYKPVYTNRLEISNRQPKLILNPIKLSESAHTLETVEVTAQKPLFVQQADRTIVNPNSSITSAGSTVLEVLAKSPGIRVDRMNNSISMNGKDGLLFMINNKIISISKESMVAMMEGMSSANIEKIELITSPPARYDAEGNAGIINIVMKQNPELGFNGNAGLSLAYTNAPVIGGNLGLNYRSNKINAFLLYDINNDETTQFVDVKQVIRKDDIQNGDIHSKREKTFRYQHFRSGFEFELTRKTLIDISVDGFHSYWKMQAYTTENQNWADSATHTKMDINEKNVWQGATASLGIKHSIDKKQKIDLSFDYMIYNNDNPSLYNVTTEHSPVPVIDMYKIRVGKLTPFRAKVFNLGYQNQINSNLSTEAGIKASLNNLNNDVEVSKTAGNIFVIDENLTSISTLKENILALYWSWQWQPSKWDLSFGIRYEHMQTDLSTPENIKLVDRSSGNFFPSGHISYSINADNKIDFAYSRRITRPTFNEMAPFVFFAGPKTFFSGNLALKPEISNGFDFGYQFKQWRISAKYSHTTDKIVRFQSEFNEETGDQIIRGQNLAYLKTLFVGLNAPLKVTSWWDARNEISGTWNQFMTQNYRTNVRKSLFSYSLNTNHSFKLPRQFSCEFSGLYNSSLNNGLNTFQPSGSVDLGIKKKIKKQSEVTLSISDLLNTNDWRIKSRSYDGKQSANVFLDFSSRKFMITFRHSFGNDKVKELKLVSGSDEERNRIVK